MSRLEDTKARLERVLGRFEAIALRMQALQTDNQSLQLALNESQERESLLRLAAYDALTEVDQAIAIIAKQTSTQNEPIENETPLEFNQPPVFDQETEEILDEESVSVNPIIESDNLSAVSIAQSLQPESEPDVDFTDDIEPIDNDDREDDPIDAVEHDTNTKANAEVEVETEYQTTAHHHNNTEGTIEEKPTDPNDDKATRSSGGSWSYLDD